MDKESFREKIGPDALMLVDSGNNLLVGYNEVSETKHNRASVVITVADTDERNPEKFRVEYPLAVGVTEGSADYCFPIGTSKHISYALGTLAAKTLMSSHGLGYGPSISISQVGIQADTPVFLHVQHTETGVVAAIEDITLFPVPDEV